MMNLLWNLEISTGINQMPKFQEQETDIKKPGKLILVYNQVQRKK